MILHRGASAGGSMTVEMTARRPSRTGTRRGRAVVVS
jgi:hypothetical protein